MLICDRCGACRAGVSLCVGYLESLRARYHLDVPGGGIDLCQRCFDGLIDRWNGLMRTYVKEPVKREP